MSGGKRPDNNLAHSYWQDVLRTDLDHARTTGLPSRQDCAEVQVVSEMTNPFDSAYFMISVSGAEATPISHQ